jgi:hypothetical protein
MSDPLFMSVADEPAPVPDPVAGDLPVVPDVVPPALGLADGWVLVLVSVPVADGELPVLLPPVVAPAPDVDPPAAPLPEPLVPPAPWASADVASIAPATVSASALIHVFIAVLPDLMTALTGSPASAQLA